jgi:hypothetical protein
MPNSKFVSSAIRTQVMSSKTWKLGAAIMMGVLCFSVFLATEPYRNRLSTVWKIQRQAALNSELREASLRRVPWISSWWPQPDTRIHIASPFGHFSIPFANIGARSELTAGPWRDSALWLPSLDGAYHWSSFAIAFWMPDGGGVMSEPGWVAENMQIDPTDLSTRPAPFRPKEEGRSDPSRDRFVVVVGAFCPSSGAKLAWNEEEGTSLFLGGLGLGGAIFMHDCSKRTPIAEWHEVPAGGPGQTKIFCGPVRDICFGWIDLADFGRMALTYSPGDAVDRVPAIAARLETLLRGWKTGASMP